MNTMKVEVLNDENELVPFYVHHNGSFDGNVIINAHPDALRSVLHHGSEGPYVSVEMSMEVMLKIVAQYVVDKRIAELEQAEWDEVLNGCGI